MDSNQLVRCWYTRHWSFHAIRCSVSLFFIRCQVRQVTKVPEGAEAGCPFCVEIQNESGWFANFALGKWLMYAAARWLAMSSTNLKSPSSQIAIRPISKAKLLAISFNNFQYLLVFKEREANASKKEDATLQASASNLVECLCMFELWELLWESSQDVLLERLANGKDAPDTESNWLWCGQGAAVDKFRKMV